MAGAPTQRSASRLAAWWRSKADSVRRVLGDHPVEGVGFLELYPVAGTGHDRKASLRLDTQQQPLAFLDMRVGGGVALTPNAVEFTLDLGQRLDKRPGAGEAPAAHPGARVIGLLQP